MIVLLFVVVVCLGTLGKEGSAFTPSSARYNRIPNDSAHVVTITNSCAWLGTVQDCESRAKRHSRRLRDCVPSFAE
jgi:hypothetical protein